MDIGTKIKTARLAQGMTQEELGDILGVKKSAIAKYESGRVVNIKRSTLRKISDVLKIPPFELVFDEEFRETQKNNSTIAQAVARMRKDTEFLSIVEELNSLTPDQLNAIKAVLSAIGK